MNLTVTNEILHNIVEITFIVRSIPKSHLGISFRPAGVSSGINFYSYVENDPVTSTDPLGLQRLPRSRTRWRECNPAERVKCVKDCGPRGMESCRVSQTFRMVSWNGVGLYKWVDGPVSCSCNDCGDSKVPVPVPVPRRLSQPGLDELRMQEESARQMYEFWKKVTIGGYVLGGVLTGGALFGGGAGAGGLVPVLVP